MSSQASDEGGAEAATLQAEDDRGRAIETDDNHVESWLAALAAAPHVPVTIVPGDLLADTFRVERRLGMGGMGVVYLAHHLVLDRKVAIKLHRADSARAAQSLVREARAIASVEHENVVVVHEVGTWEHYVFVAMEYVDGWTAREWVTLQPRSWREIVLLYLKAGQGLRAAHERGLTHRDFKPDNVLVGRDGRVRVADFGLARAAAADGELTSNSDVAPRATATATEGLMGSPAYMAPEQYRTSAVDARADQFGFCVSLFEALSGSRPFAGDSLPMLAQAIIEGHAESLRAEHGPAHIRAALRRGMEVEPDHRYPDMAALLADLARDPARARWRAIRWASAVGVTVTATWLLTRAPDPREQCVETPALDGWWDAAAQQRVRDAFVGTGRPSAAESFTAVDRLLGERVAAARAALDAACTATFVAGTMSQAQLEDHRGCLLQSEREQGALVELFGAQPADVVERSVAAAEALPAVTRCSAALGFRTDDVADADRERANDLLRDVARVDEVRDAGLYAQAVREGDALLPEVTAFGYPAIEARLLLAIATAHGRLRKPEPAAPVLHTALQRAVVADDPRLAAEITLQLMFNDGYLRNDASLGEAWTALAAGWLDRIEHPDDLQVRFLHNRALVLRTAERFEESLGEAEAALAVLERSSPASGVGLAALLGVIGESHRVMGYPERAIGMLERSAQAYRAALGPSHPSHINAINLLGSARLTKGDLEAAERDFREALDLAAAGPGSGRALIDVRSNLAGVLANTGRMTEALEILEQAWRDAAADAVPDDLRLGLARNLAAMNEAAGKLDRARALNTISIELARQTGGEDSVPFAEALLMRAALATDDDARALADADQGLEILHTKLDPHVPTVAYARTTRAGVLERLGRCDDALDELDRAIRDLTAAVGADHPVLMRAWMPLGRCHERLGHHRAAVEALERARAVMPGRGIAPNLEPWLVRALVGEGQSPKARALYDEVRARAQERGDTDTLAELDAIVPVRP